MSAIIFKALIKAATDAANLLKDSKRFAEFNEELGEEISEFWDNSLKRKKS